MNPFFVILTVAMKAIEAGLAVYARKSPADAATANRARYCVECLKATVEKRPLPKL
jgi:hypothetical protein